MIDGVTTTGFFPSRRPSTQESSMSTSPTGRLRFASAISDSANTPDAQREVLHALRQQLDGDDTDLIVVFATMHHSHHLDQICNDIESALGSRVTLGCTCAGVIGTRRELQDTPGLSVLAGVLPGTNLQGFSYEQFDWPAVLESPSALRNTINPAEDENESDSSLAAILLLTDPFSTPTVKLLPAFNTAFGPVPVFGGMASGAAHAGQNRLVLNGEVMDSGAVGVAIAGNIDVQTTVSQGCRPIGEPMVITRSKRNVVQELGGRNPLVVLHEMTARLDHGDRDLIQNYGLLVGRVINEYKSRFGRGDFLIRAMADINTDDGYLAIGDPGVRTGQTIQFHIRDAQSAADDFKMMLNAQKVHGQAHGALLFTCTGRGQRLFDQPHADASMVYDALGNAPLAGFFCAGEIGPIAEHCYTHSHTACLAVFRESS
jgi:small ligand-binding sensory domain FIST